ncbi:hypothetical protein GQ44DRAFT_695924 [Phaeosphaeriaceae sp. PMI808]|nr:hypothetical protein GQ44DRAFT_695924 [Phaeosphaeriaceae sp. PMI808]
MLEAARREYQEDEVQPEVLKILQPGNEFLQEVVDQFGRTRGLANKAKVACFYELKSSNVGSIVGGRDRTRLLVSESSGCLDLSDSTSKFSLSRTHFDMNKFGKPTEEDFEIVMDVVKNMVKNTVKVPHGYGHNAMGQVESVLENRAQKRSDNLKWRHSVIDLLTLLELPSSIEARKRLAEELHIQVDKAGTPKQNNALRNAIMRELAANSGKVQTNIGLSRS